MRQCAVLGPFRIKCVVVDRELERTCDSEKREGKMEVQTEIETLRDDISDDLFHLSSDSL